MKLRSKISAPKANQWSFSYLLAILIYSFLTDISTVSLACTEKLFSKNLLKSKIYQISFLAIDIFLFVRRMISLSKASISKIDY